MEINSSKSQNILEHQQYCKVDSILSNQLKTEPISVIGCPINARHHISPKWQRARRNRPWWHITRKCAVLGFRVEFKLTVPSREYRNPYRAELNQECPTLCFMCSSWKSIDLFLFFAIHLAAKKSFSLSTYYFKYFQKLNLNFEKYWN